MSKSTRFPFHVRANQNRDGLWYVWVDGIYQSPTFNSEGAAMVFGGSIMAGNRKPEPWDLSRGPIPR